MVRAEDNKRFVYFLVALNILPHSVELPRWIIALGLTFVLWKYASDHFRIPTPNRWTTPILGFLCGLGIFNEYGTVMGDEASASVLVLAVALKLFEVKKYRDIMIVTILCYFLLMSKLISSQSISMTIFMIVDLVLITSLLAMHHSPVDQGKAGALFRRSFRMALVSSPIVLGLFIVFPRFNLGIFNKTQRDLAEMGFSDRLDPGSISELMSSDQVVFRVRVIGDEQLSNSQMYWRGAVLADADGLRWNRGLAYVEKPPSSRALDLSSLTQVEIHREPSGEKALFALDWPIRIEFPDDVRKMRVRHFNHQVFESRTEFIKREYYTVYANPIARNVNWERFDPQPFLALKNHSDRVQGLAEELKKNSSGSTPAAYIDSIYKFYQENKFRYSLRNPEMKSLDDFLFDAKQGFCEHYAGATAYLLRMMGVPTRVVVGFQGGKKSLLGDYLLVRALDAHAWMEYWDEESKSWMRLDPTSIVAPARIAGGAEELLNDLGADPSSRQGLEWLQKFAGVQFMKNYFALQMLFDQVDASWSNFLLKYDFEYQKDVLAEMGLIGSARWILAGFSALFLVIFVGILLIVFSKSRTKGDPTSEIYWLLVRKLSKAGLKKQPTEGPLSLGERALLTFPAQKQSLEDAFTKILLYRYSGERPSPEEVNELKNEVKSLRL